MTDIAPVATNINDHKWLHSVLGGAVGMAILGAAGILWQVVQATWNAATIVTKMDARIERVEHGLKELKGETTEIKNLLTPMATIAVKPALKAVLRSKDRP